MLKGELVETITTDGLELKGFFVDNKNDFAIFHSHGTAGDFYTHKFIEKEAEMLTHKGISFLTANNRGHDVYADIRKHAKNAVTWSGHGGGFEKFEDCLVDIKAWLSFLNKRGINKIILQSHSLTQKILYYQWVKKDPNIIGQIHLSPCNDAGFVRMKLGQKKYKKINSEIKGLIKKGRGNELLDKKLYVVCPMSALAYYGYITEEGPGNLFPYHNPNSKKWKALNSIKEPILAVFGDNDVYINNSCPQNNSAFVSSLFKKQAKKSRKVTTVVIPNANHSYIEKEAPLINEISIWLKDNYKL